MGEYATLTFWRKLEQEKESEPSIFQNLYAVKDNGDAMVKYLESIGEDFFKFGRVFYREINGHVYYSHLPFGFKEQFHQQVCKYNILPEWLLCFTFDEMTVTGDGVGVFKAETTVGEAKNRVDSLDLDNADAKWHLKRCELYKWLGVHANPDNILTLSSELIYYSTDGEFNAEYVKKDINKKVKSIREQLTVPYWNKCS